MPLVRICGMPGSEHPLSVGNRPSWEVWAGRTRHASGTYMRDAGLRASHVRARRTSIVTPWVFRMSWQGGYASGGCGPQRRMPIAWLRDVGYRSPRVDLRLAAGAVTRRRRDSMGCGPWAGGGRVAALVSACRASGGSWPQRRMPIVGPRVHSVGYRSPGCATSDNDRFACIDRLSW